MERKMEDPKPSLAASNCRAIFMIAPLVAYVLCVALNAVLNIPGISPFNNTIGDLSHKYDTGITPSDATFGIWGLIYLWQAALVIYLSTLVCRKCDGVPIYILVPFIPTVFIFVYTLNLISNPAWIVVFLQEAMIKATLLLVLGVVSCAICLASSCVQLNSCGALLESKGLKADIWCTRIIVQNGIALYMAWISCATLINVVVVLHYYEGMSMDKACWGALIALNVILLVWFTLETFVFDRQLRYVFAHYISYVIGFVGIYKQRYDPEVPYTIYELALLAFISTLALTKLTVMIVRGVVDPIHYSRSYIQQVYKM